MSYSRSRRPANDLVGRRLEDAALGVGSRVDAEHVAARRHQLARAGLRIGDDDPRVVERGVAGVGDLVRGSRSSAVAPFWQSITAKRNRMFSQWVMICERDVLVDVRRIDERHVAIGIELERGETLHFARGCHSEDPRSHRIRRHRIVVAVRQSGLDAIDPARHRPARRRLRTRIAERRAVRTLVLRPSRDR